MLRLILMALSIGALSGCHQPVPPVELTAQDITLADEGERDALLDTCLDTLRDHRFKLDRVDRHAGVITTFPITSQQVFEFWRNDVATAYDVLEATLSTIRRRVEIRLLGSTDPAHQQVVVTVYRERFSTPDRQYNNSAAAFRVFSRSLPSTTGKEIVPERDDAWLQAGRDGALEHRLLQEIARRFRAGEWSLSAEASEPTAPAPAES